MQNLDAGQEGNLTTWLAAATLVAGAVAALLHVLAVDTRRRTFLAAAFPLAYLSFDEIAQIHENFERVGRRAGFPDRLAEAMDVLVLLPVLLATVGVLMAIASYAAEFGRLLTVGYIALAVAVLLDEGAAPAVTNPLRERGVSWPEEVRDAIEEALELCGFIFVAVGLAALTTRALILLGRERRNAALAG